MINYEIERVGNLMDEEKKLIQDLMDQITQIWSQIDDDKKKIDR
jgi:hypothetical protein